MDIKARKIELLDWLSHINDATILGKIEALKKEVSSYTNKQKAQQPVFGRLKDKISIAADFDTPLDDMKEYM